MGTNYYLHRKICPHCKHSEQRIHIGKSSHGWTFTFQGFKHEWDDIKVACEDDWRKELKDGEIINEYGEAVSYDEFWQMVDSKRNAENNHARDYPKCSWLDDKGNSFTSGDFS